MVPEISSFYHQKNGIRVASGENPKVLGPNRLAMIQCVVKKKRRTLGIFLQKKKKGNFVNGFSMAVASVLRLLFQSKEKWKENGAIRELRSMVTRDSSRKWGSGYSELESGRSLYSGRILFFFVLCVVLFFSFFLFFGS